MLALDLGFSAIKAKSDTGVFTCPSAVIDMSNSSMKTETASAGIYRFEGRTYLVGKKALLRPDQNYKLDIDWLIRMMPLMIAHTMTMMDIVEEDVLVVGLPPESFFDNHFRLKTRVQSFVVNQKEYRFKDVSVLPQGVGSYFDFCSKNDIDEDDANVLVDIGANTLNLMVTQGTRVMPEGSQQLSRQGACVAVEKVISVLRRHDIIKSHAQAHEILKTGKCEEYNLSLELPDILKNFAEMVLNHVFNKFANYSLQKLIFSGGGANLIRNYLSKNHRFARISHFVDDSTFSNVRGYYLIKQASMQNQE